MSQHIFHDLLKKPETALAKLVEKAHAIEALNDTLSKVLEAELLPHCRVGCYQSGILTLFTENASWGTRLRYSVPQLLSNLRSLKAWAGLCSIQIKIQKHWHQTAPTSPPPPPLLLKPSATNVAELRALANLLKKESGTEMVVNSLERLAKL